MAVDIDGLLVDVEQVVRPHHAPFSVLTQGFSPVRSPFTPLIGPQDRPASGPPMGPPMTLVNGQIKMSKIGQIKLATL